MVISPGELVSIREREEEESRTRRVNHTALASCFSPASLTASRDFWYSLRNFFLASIENRVIVMMLSTTHEIWMPKFMPTEEAKRKQWSVTQNMRGVQNRKDSLSFLVPKQIASTVLERL